MMHVREPRAKVQCLPFPANEGSMQQHDVCMPNHNVDSLFGHPILVVGTNTTESNVLLHLLKDVLEFVGGKYTIAHMIMLHGDTMGVQHAFKEMFGLNGVHGSLGRLVLNVD